MRILESLVAGNKSFEYINDLDDKVIIQKWHLESKQDTPLLFLFNLVVHDLNKFNMSEGNVYIN